ncbi:hypothetical protein COOONC_05893 [Cooperia oncophora]
MSTRRLEVQGDLENAKSKFEKVLRIKEDRRARAALAKMDRKKRSPSVEILEDDSDKPKSKNPKRSDIEEEKRKRRQVREVSYGGVFRSIIIRRSDYEKCGLFCVGPLESRPVSHLLIVQMPVSICDAEDSHDENCGASCSALSDVEKRRINRQLFLAFPPEGARHSGQRMFFFIRGYDELVREDIEESECVLP